MKDKVYMVVTVTESEKNFSYVLCVSGSSNLVSVLSGIRGLTSANVCKSRKAAAEIAECWNDGYKANGTYMFSAGEEATA